MFAHLSYYVCQIISEEVKSYVYNKFNATVTLHVTQVEHTDLLRSYTEIMMRGVEHKIRWDPEFFIFSVFRCCQYLTKYKKKAIYYPAEIH
jgi:hypothetical protein